VNPLTYLSEHAKAIVAALLAAVAPFVAAQAANTGIDSNTWTLAVLAAIAALVGVGGVPNADNKKKAADSGAPPTQVAQLVTAAQLLTTAGQQIAAHKPVTVPMLTPGQADTINRLEQAYSAYSTANPAMKLPPVLPTVEGTAPEPKPSPQPRPAYTGPVPPLNPAPAESPPVSFVDPIGHPVDHSSDPLSSAAPASTGPITPVSEPVGATAVSATP